MRRIRHGFNSSGSIWRKAGDVRCHRVSGHSLHDEARLLRARVELLSIAIVAAAIAITAALAILVVVAVAIVVLMAVAIGLVAAHRFDMSRHQFAIENMTLELYEVTGIYALGSA